MKADRRLALRTEMRLPGEALLEFVIDPADEGARSRLVQTARFRPRGLLGLADWYVAMPLHGLVFARMLEGLRRTAEAEPGPQSTPASSSSEAR